VSLFAQRGAGWLVRASKKGKGDIKGEMFVDTNLITHVNLKALVRKLVAWLCLPLPRRQAGVPQGGRDDYHAASGRLRIRTRNLNLV